MVGRRATDALLVLLEVCFFLDTASGSKEEAQDTGYVGQDAVVANWRLRAGQVQAQPPPPLPPGPVMNKPACAGLYR
jgi:hypothetical protein